MLKTVFTVHLNEKILPKKVAIGKFDGNNPCIVAATHTDKVFKRRIVRHLTFGYLLRCLSTIRIAVP